MTKISILVPTRSRPANVERLMRSAYETATLPPEFWFYVDGDDPIFESVCLAIENHGGQYVVGDRIVLSEMWNHLVTEASHDVLMHCGDDIIFRTIAWDAHIVTEFERYPDGIVLVHGDDGYQHDRIATHGFYHRRWVETLGRLVPPYFSSDYNDLWNTEIADAIGRRVYLPHVLTEHMHPSAGKAELDQTHVERLARHDRDNVAGLYDSLAHERVNDVAKLRLAITQARIGA